MKAFLIGDKFLFLQIMQINVVTQRGFVPVDEQMQVVDQDGNLVRDRMLLLYL